MPDHFRQQPKDSMGPRSPPDLDRDHPLSLVIGGRRDNNHNPPSPHGHKIVHAASAPADLDHSGRVTKSPGHSSSGYSDDSASPSASPQRQEEEERVQEERGEVILDATKTVVDHEEEIEAQREMEEEEEEEEDVPLALVVDKAKLVSGDRTRMDTVQSGDSGHEDYFSGGSSPILQPAAGGTPPRMNYSPPEVVLSKRQQNDEDVDEDNNEEEENAKSGRTLETQVRVEIQPNVTIAKVLIEDTGAEDLSATRASGHSPNAGIKIKDFAKMSSPQSDRLQSTMARQGGMLHEMNEHDLSHLDDDDDDDLSSDISSTETWTTENSSGLVDVSRMYNGGGGSNGGDAVFPCEYCDKVFVNKYHLQSHVVTHTGERAFSCRKCGKCFGRKSTLRAHMTTHTKTSNFMCPLCEKACNDNNSLEEHIRMHTGEKPFVCTICSKAYARKSHLNVHYRVHTGERPFVCVDCGKDFTEKRFLNDHMQTAHSGHDGPLKCPNCFREFAYKTSLKQHLKKQMCVKNINRGQGNASHGNHAKQFQCPFCEKSYSWKQTLKQHVSMYHRNKVHTDEFWKYELAKHRRAGLDNTVNEDMWMKQLGKHADDAIVETKRSSSSTTTMTTPDERREQYRDGSSSRSSSGISLRQQQQQQHQSEKPDDDKWLDQIHHSTAQNQTERAQVATEIKLLALQSLHFMTMGLGGQKPVAFGQAPSEPQQQLQQHDRSEGEEDLNNNKGYTPLESMASNANRNSFHKENYLSLLARIHGRSSSPSKEQQHSRIDETIAAAVAEDGGSPPPPPISRSPPASGGLHLLPDIKEEPAAKRTQMWLAQLGRYRQKSLLQEELDRNHEEMWEEQIAKAKLNPVKSPLEPVEITLDDDDSNNSNAKRHRHQAAATKSIVLPPPPYAHQVAAAAQVRAGAVARAQLAPPKEATALSGPPRCVMVPQLMSALQLHPPPQPQVFGGCQQQQQRPSPPSATITRPEEKASAASVVLIPKPKYPDISSDAASAEERKFTLPLENELEEPLSMISKASLPRTEDGEDSGDRKDTKTQQQQQEKKEEGEGPSSFLKSILMERAGGRKRPSMDYPYPQPVAKEQRMLPPTPYHPWDLHGRNSHGGGGGGGDSTDILRRRLLGMKDPVPPPAPAPAVVPAAATSHQQPTGINSHLLVPAPPSANLHLLTPRLFVVPPTPPHHQPPPQTAPATPPPSSRTSPLPAPLSPLSPISHQEQQRHEEDQEKGEGEEEEEEDERQKQQKAETLSHYAHTSVLKHLLYRYTESASNLP